MERGSDMTGEEQKIMRHCVSWDSQEAGSWSLVNHL